MHFEIRFRAADASSSSSSSGSSRSNARRLSLSAETQAKLKQDIAGRKEIAFADMVTHAEKIAVDVYAATFRSNLINALVSISKARDGLNHDRFGWMHESDIEVVSALALPVGVGRADISEGGGLHYDEISGTTQRELILFGILIGTAVLIAILIFMYIRLLKANAALSKDKEEAVTYRDITERIQTYLINCFRGGGSRGAYGRVTTSENDHDNDSLAYELGSAADNQLSSQDDMNG